MRQTFLTHTYLIVLLFTSIVAAFRLQRPSRSIKFLCMYILLGSFTEFSSVLSIMSIGENYLISNAYDICCILLLTGYYLSHSTFNQKKKFIYIALLAILSLSFLSITCTEKISRTHITPLEFINSSIILLGSFTQVYHFAVQAHKDTKLTDAQLIVPILFIANLQISLWCKSVAYTNGSLTQADIILIYKTLLVSHTFFYGSLGVILLFLCPANKYHGPF